MYDAYIGESSKLCLVVNFIVTIRKQHLYIYMLTLIKMMGILNKNLIY